MRIISLLKFLNSQILIFQQFPDLIFLFNKITLRILFLDYYFLFHNFCQLKFNMDHSFDEQDIAELYKILDEKPFKPISKTSFGSYGEIFKIVGVDDGKKYALKVICKDRLLRERKLHQAIIENIILSKLKHPGIIKYYQSIENSEYISHVLEHCPYGNLAQAFKQIDKNIEMFMIREQIIRFYLAQIVEAVDYMHKQNLLHRDLKLENILIGEDLNCRIIDFGTAKSLKDEEVFNQSQIKFLEKVREFQDGIDCEESYRMESFVGSANYLAPQSILFKYSTKSDIWALGVLIYRLFHNRLPFRGRNNFQVLTQIQEFAHNEKINFDKNLHPHVQNLILACLHRDPSQRPSTQQLKKHPYFSGINFSKIYFKKSPVDPKCFKFINRDSQISFETVYFEVGVQKKMLLGNHKPRILKIYPNKEKTKVLMSYWHIGSSKPKNQFQLKPEDFACRLSQNQFTVTNKDTKYSFRVKDKSQTDKIVKQINNIIINHVIDQ